jgi:hypothetical protein
MPSPAISRNPFIIAQTACRSRATAQVPGAMTLALQMTAQIVITRCARLTSTNMLRALALSRTSLLSNGYRLLFRELKDTAHSWEVFQ